MNTVKLRNLLTEIYGEEAGTTALEQLLHIIKDYHHKIPLPQSEGLSQCDSILITYADQIQQS